MEMETVDQFKYRDQRNKKIRIKKKIGLQLQPWLYYDQVAHRIAKVSAYILIYKVTCHYYECYCIRST